MYRFYANQRVCEKRSNTFITFRTKCYYIQDFITFGVVYYIQAFYRVPHFHVNEGLRFDQISPRSRKISQSSWRGLFYLAQMSFISARSRRDLREITNLTQFLARSRLSRRNLFHIGEISFVLQKYLSSHASLGEISTVSRPRSLSSRADLS